MKLKKGDNVIVIAGKDKGKTGVIARVMRAEGQVIIDGVNVRKRHLKGEAGIVDIFHPIDASNVAFVDPKTKKASRLGYKIEKDKKVRISKASGSAV